MDLADRLHKRKKAQQLLDAAKETAGTMNVAFRLEAGRVKINLENATPDQILELAAKLTPDRTPKE